MSQMTLSLAGGLFVDDARYRTQRNWGCRIHFVTMFGLPAVVLENDLIRVTILTGKGADVVEFNYKPHDLDIVWLSPGGIRNPGAFLSTSADPLATFLDVYPGGWQDVFPSAGEPAIWNGAQFGQHGEICNMPWMVAIEEDRPERVVVKLSVRGQKVPSFIERTVSLDRGDAGLNISERVTNTSPVPIDAMWSQHITFGYPFMTLGSRITLPEGVTGIAHDTDVGATGRRVAGSATFDWPTAPTLDGGELDLSLVPPQGTPNDLVYLTNFPGDTAWYQVQNPDQPVGVRVEWSTATLPYLWYWQEFGGTTGYPWYGQVYTIGLEPNSSYPTNGLPDAVANGSAMSIGPGEQRAFTMRVAITR
jgi:hypothetical protein